MLDGAAVAALATDLGGGPGGGRAGGAAGRGVADAVREAGIACFGPRRGRRAARGRKAFAKDVMAAAGVPTAPARVCDTAEEVAAALDEFGPPYVVKDDGLAAGKGVVVTADRRGRRSHHAESCGRVRDRGVPRRPRGVAVRGHRRARPCCPLQPAQDFKRACDGDDGAEHRRHGRLHAAALGARRAGRGGHPDGAAADGRRDGPARHPLPGLLYAGLALTTRGVRVDRVQRPLRRPGDPAAAGAARPPLGALLQAAATGVWRGRARRWWKDGAAVAVVVAAAGYPGPRASGDVISGLRRGRRRSRASTSSRPARATTRRRAGHRRRAGAGRHRHRRRPRRTLATARTKASAKIHIDGAHHRTDIAAAACEASAACPDSPTCSPAATRVADLASLWSPEHKIVLERRLWLAVLAAQRDLGVDRARDGRSSAYEAVVDQVDLASIAARERVTRHDVKARIEEFSALAGHEHVHKGMTSRDLTENVEQLQIRSSLRLIRDRSSRRWPGSARLAARARRPGRWPGAPTTSPRRPPRSASASPRPPTSCWSRCERLEELIARYPLRGIKGPVGTGQDMLDLLDGDAEQARRARAAGRRAPGLRATC